MWVLPSRARPHNCARLFAAEWNTPGVLCVDDDDPSLGAYRSLTLPPGWTMDVGSRGPLSLIYNRAFNANPTRQWYGVLADDVLPETMRWDSRLVKAALPDGMAFGDDGINGQRHATHFVLAGELVRRVGWLALPGLQRLYIDTVWNDIARDVRRYLPDVLLTHLHFSNGKALRDATYRKPKGDRAIYERWKERQ